MTSLYYGLESEEDVEKDFREMKQKITGSGLVFRDKKTGETKDVKNRSRWNTEFRYDMSVKGRLEAEVKGLKNVTMITLTYDMTLARQLIPGWWVLSEQAFIILFNNMFVSNFLKQVHGYRKSKGWSQKYVGGVVEFHTAEGGKNKGILHNHLLFSGQAPVAPLDKLWQFWGLCQYQGIEVTVKRGCNAASYIAKYVGKTLNGFQDDPDLRELAKWFWKFRRRMYNFRHKKKGNKRIGLPAQDYEVIAVSYRGVASPINKEKKVYAERMRYLRGNSEAHWYPYEDDE
jgi:hypothetical protein